MKNATIIKDYTTGNVPKQLIVFSAPFMLSNALQVLYSLADMMIVGRIVGSAGLSAVSSASQIFTFMTMLGLGFSSGGQVLIAQLIGSKKREALNRAIGTLFSVTLLLGAVMGAIGLCVGKNVLTLLNTPAEAYSMASDYTLVCSLGIIFTYGYNMVSAALRGMGDSKSPFLFILIASVLNIIGDLVLVGLFDMKCAGAALATIFGQAVSFLFSLVFLYKKRAEIGFDFKLSSFAIDTDMLRILVRMGVPFAVQSCAVNISMMFVNSLVNSLGIYASAVFGVGVKIDDIINKITQGMAFAASTMCAQNIAAGEFRRTKKVVYWTLLLCGACYLVFTVIYLLFYREMFALFDDSEQVLSLSYTFVSAIVWGFPAMVLMRSGNGLMRGIGNANLSLAMGLLDAFVFRIGLSLLLGTVLEMGLYGFFLGYALAAYGTGVPAMIYFFSGKWKSYRLIRA